MESAPLFVAMLWVAVISRDTGGINTAVRLWTPTHISSLLQPLPPFQFFFENSSDLRQSQDWPWRRLGGGAVALICPLPRDDANDGLGMEFSACLR